MSLMLNCRNCKGLTQANKLEMNTIENFEADKLVLDAAYVCSRCRSMYATKCVVDTDPETMDAYIEWDLSTSWRDDEKILEDMATWWPRDSSMPTLQHVPENVESFVEEAYRCFDSDCFSAAVVMARAAIEAVAKERGATGKTLADKIRHLKELEALDNRADKMFTAIKNNGNRVAHADPGERYTKAESKMLLTVLQLVLESVYEHTALIESVAALASSKKSSDE